MLLEGQVFRDRYQIQRQLGQNAGRRTLLAQDIHTQEQVVLKILSFNSNFRWEDLKLFEREAKTLQSLSHPAIPRYLDYFELDQPNDRGFVLVQTYLDAPSLQQWIEQGRAFSEQEVQQIAKALLKVLSGLHGYNPPIIHRDIKPSNILLKGDRSGHQAGELYLVDFGSVQTVVREMGTMTIVGTYGYMPPEQFSGRAFPASDLYSLGATLIYLVTGTHPADLLQEDLQLQFHAITHLTPQFEQWLEKITHPNRKQRFSDAQVALEALENPQECDRLLHRPEQTKITLQKTADSLEIHIPATKPSGLVQGCSCVFVSVFLVLILGAFLTTIQSGSWFGGLISLFCLLTVATASFGSIFNGTADTHIWIDRQWMKVTHKAFGLKLPVFQASRQSLYQLTYIKRFYRRDPEGYIMAVPPELKIWAKMNLRNPRQNTRSDFVLADSTEERFYHPKSKGISYRIGGSHAVDSEHQFLGGLTTQELEWLAQELSHWLELPLVKE